MNTKKEFIERLGSDLTFKADLSGAQRSALHHVAEALSAAREKLKTEVENVLRMCCRETDQHFEEGQKLLRKMERRANAAIANDWTEADAEYVSPPVEFESEYVESTKQSQCHIVTRVFYTLGVTVATIIPYGRNASIFATLIEDCRGEYIDGVNAGHAPTDKSPTDKSCG